MKSQTQTRAPAVTLAAYLALVGSMAYAVTASAGQVAADAHAQHDCVIEHVVGDVATDADAVAEPNVALPGEPVDAQAAAAPVAPAVKATKRSRRKNQVESSLFHF